MIRKIITALLLTLICSLTWAQITEREGLYYDKEGQLYSGIHEEKNENGSTKFKLSIFEGKLHGESTYFFENGEVNEIRLYHHNQMHGTWKTFNNEKIKTGIANYSLGKKNGIWRIWDDNGTLRYDMLYKDGKKTGEWKIYNEKGELVATRKYNAIQ